MMMMMMTITHYETRKILEEYCGDSQYDSFGSEKWRELFANNEETNSRF